MQHAGDWKTVFHIGLELESAGTVEIVVGLSWWCLVAAWAYGTHSEGTHGIGTAHIELLGIRHLRRIAIGIRRTHSHAAHQP